MTAAPKPKILKLGVVYFAHDKWAELAKVADVVECTSRNRQEFFDDLKTKYSDVTNITRTYASIKQTGRFDAELAAHLPASVKSVSHCGAGYDQVDPDPLTKRNIQLSNVTTPVEGPTATAAVHLTLSALRNFQIGHNLLIDGKWGTTDKSAGVAFGREPEGLTVGILGMGGIGRAYKKRLAGFGVGKFIYHNRRQLSAELADGAAYVTFDELLAQSDVLFLSLPLNENTRHTINKDTIAKLKEGAVIINTARGPIVSEKDLLPALKSGKVGAYGSDVFEFEPEVPKELRELPNVVSLPHMGTHSVDAIKSMEEWVVDNVLSHLYTGKVKSVVPDQTLVEFNHEPVL